MRRLITTLALTLSLHSVASAQQAAPPMPDVQKLGPQVGSVVPPFSLQDQRGQTRTLTSVLGPKGAMVLFYRSADW